MKKVKILISKGMTFWARENEDTYSRNPQDLLNYLDIDYKLENKDAILGVSAQNTQSTEGEIKD